LIDIPYSFCYKEQSINLQGENVFNKIIHFLREVMEELRKVSWSDKKQTIGSTMIVILLVIAVAIFVGLVDFGLSVILGILLK